MSQTPQTDILRCALKNLPLTAREEELLNAMASIEVERGIYKKEFSKAVEAASIFQPGGKFYEIAKLTPGRSSIAEGIAWLVSERERLQSELEKLR